MAKKKSHYEFKLADAIIQAFSGASAKVSIGSCTIYSSEPTKCPLCGQRIAANELHQCSKPEAK